MASFGKPVARELLWIGKAAGFPFECPGSSRRNSHVLLFRFAGGAYIDVYVCDRFVTMRHGDAYIQGDVCATRDAQSTAEAPRSNPLCSAAGGRVI